MGQVSSGLIKAAIIAAIAVAVGFCIISLGNGFFWFILGGIIVSAFAILGGILDLAVGLILDIMAYWVLVGLNLLPKEKLLSLLTKNLETVLENPQKGANILIPVGFFLAGLFIVVIILSFIKPGPGDGRVILAASLATGLVAGVILFLLHGRVPDLRLVKSISLFGGIVGFIGGMMPGPPL
jgi:hypothetical protein